MVVVKLVGGLGNQMFQYAFGRRMSVANQTELYLDATKLMATIKQKEFTFRNYALDVFNINAKFTFLSNISLNCKMLRNFIFFLQLFISYIKGKIFKNYLVIEKHPAIYEPLLLEKKGNLYIAGQWNFEDYFQDIEEIIRNEFTLKSEMSSAAVNVLRQVQVNNSISIHVRRGDYVSLGLDIICSLDYYKKSIQYIEEQVENPFFYIFSDDIEWAKNNLVIKNSVYVSSPQIVDYEELVLMSKCKHNIIANSSFSWWGAWLNKNSDKIIIAPKKWLNYQLPIKLPKAWVTI